MTPPFGTLADHKRLLALAAGIGLGARAILRLVIGGIAPAADDLGGAGPWPAFPAAGAAPASSPVPAAMRAGRQRHRRQRNRGRDARPQRLKFLMGRPPLNSCPQRPGPNTPSLRDRTRPVLTVARLTRRQSRPTKAPIRPPDLPATFVRIGPGQGGCGAALSPTAKSGRGTANQPMRWRGSLQRRVDLDIEAPRRLGVEIGVGAEPAGVDAVDGAEVVDLVHVAGDAERADDLARRRRG